MLGVRSAALLSLIALGVACTVWLAWDFAREIEEPQAAAGGADLRPSAAPANPPVAPAVADRDPLDVSLRHHLPPWARSPEERIRWMDALRRDRSKLSPFERRLWIGDLLEHLLWDLRSGALQPVRAQKLFAELFHAGGLRLERTPLVAEATSLRRGCDEVRLRAALGSLIRPTRTRRAFTLHGREGDALATGLDLRLRVWTPRGRSVTSRMVKSTLSLLVRLDAVAGVESPASVDVLATETCGKDVLPRLSQLPFPFIGVYVPADRLAVVGTRYPPREFRRLLQHEVIHAWQHASRPGWRTTFTIEGLATYGSHFTPTDKRFTLPETRLYDDFAWLLHTVALLEDRGVRMARLDLGALVRARSSSFYSLGWFAYAVAEACFAYVGTDAIVAALQSGNEEALLNQCVAIEWPTLLRWLGARATRGKAAEAWFVTESTQPGEGGEVERPLLSALLTDLGIEVPAGHRDEVAALLSGGRRRAGSKTGVSSAAPEREKKASEPGPQYVTERTCKKCHFRTHRSWRRLHHAHAFELLAPGAATAEKRAAGLAPARDFRSDGTCLRCHTTGYGTSSGYTVPGEDERVTKQQARRRRALQGVGCEACHGPGSDYTPYKKAHEDYLRLDLAARGAHIPLRKEHCTACHTPGCPTMPSDYAFDIQASRWRESAHEHFPLKRDHGEDPRWE